MGNKRMECSGIFAGSGNLGCEEMEDTSVVPGSRDGVDAPLSDSVGRNANCVGNFWSSGWDKLLGDFQSKLRGNRIWRQLDDLTFGDVPRSMETFCRLRNCIFWRGCFLWNRYATKKIKKKQSNSFFPFFGNRISGNFRMVKKECRASTIVEMAYLMPVVLLMWMLIIFALFYYHDKTLVIGAAYETAAVSCESYREVDAIDTEEVNAYFWSRIKGKLLFYSAIPVETSVEDEMLIVSAKAKARGMTIDVVQKAEIIYPERDIRKIQRIKEGLEDLED